MDIFNSDLLNDEIPITHPNIPRNGFLHFKVAFVVLLLGAFYYFIFLYIINHVFKGEGRELETERKTATYTHSFSCCNFIFLLTYLSL